MCQDDQGDTGQEVRAQLARGRRGGFWFRDQLRGDQIDRQTDRQDKLF